jgi:hypothetical protein
VPAKAIYKKQKERAGMPKKNIAGATLAQGRVTYMLELARGSSHIASTRTPKTLNRAIAEVLTGFCQVHGLQALGVFRELLALDVEQRGNQHAAAAVRRFAPELTGGKKPVPGGIVLEKSLTLPRGKYGQDLREWPACSEANDMDRAA